MRGAAPAAREGPMINGSTLYWGVEKVEVEVFLAAPFYVLICISQSEFLSGFSWYKTLKTSS